MRHARSLAGALLLAIAPVQTASQSPVEVERLAALGQVWGLLKYFHPGVATGTIDWDSALVATVPRVRTAWTASGFDDAIRSLLDAAGSVASCGDRSMGSATGSCAPVAPDSMRRNVDFRWLDASSILGADVVRRLQVVRDNPHRGSGRYVRYLNTATFPSDTAHGAPEYPSEAVRLLALFRFWNAARYYFPYMYANGGDWNAVLGEFIPRLIDAADAEAYHFTVYELTTRLNDAHVNANSTVILDRLGGRYPAFEARSIGGQVVVFKLPRGVATGDYPLRAGDVITHVDGRQVAALKRERSRFVAAGNPAVYERKLLTAVLRGNGDSATYVIERSGQTLTRTVAVPPRPTGAVPRLTYAVSELAYVLPNTTIGYIHMGDLNPVQVDSALAIVRHTTGIVMDVRNNPRSTLYHFARFFNPEARPFVKFARVDSTSPGQVVWEPPVMAGDARGNASSYRGRVAILVDERTQSHAEFSVMALRTAPENTVVGSQTAGADGNVTPLVLPGGIRTLFTGLGVYYPDGRETQRIGIVPDIEVRPTLAGLRAGRDEVLERALEYIRTGR